MSRLRSLLAAAGLVVAGFALAPASPAAAAACSGTSGVTVVIGSSVTCAPGDPSSALAALQGAGHSVTMVQRFPGALCRIDGSPASDPCVNMPPASAYWAFYHAGRGGSWTYSQTGVTTYNPPPGTAVGFAFGAGARPGIAPPAASTPSTAPRRPATPTPRTTTNRPSATPTRPAAPTPSPRQSTNPRPTPSRGSGGAGSTSVAQPSSPTPGRTSGATPTAEPSVSVSGSVTPPSSPSGTTGAKPSVASPASPEASAGSTSGASAQAAPATTQSDGSGLPQVLTGLALIALVGGAAVWMSQRRRQPR